MGGGTNTVADRQTSIQIQTSAYGGALPVVFGTNRIAANLIWFGNFVANSKTTTQGGKGGGGATSTDYTYTCAAILALGEGVIAGIGRVWKDKDQTTLAALGMSLFTGTATQSVWSGLTSYNTAGNWSRDTAFGYATALPIYTNQQINYSSTAYLAASSYDLGSTAAVPNHSFEVFGQSVIGGGNLDANPSAIIPVMLGSQQFGVGFPAAQIDPLVSYATYCTAAGLFISPAYIEQRAAADCIQEICEATNAAPVWSGGILKILPYGDTAITGNGATYTPNLTPLYDLTDDDFLVGDDPIIITRATPADAYNRVQVQFRNRINNYNQEVVSVEDQDAIEKYGLKVASVITMDFVCVASIAKQMAQLALQRMLYKRNIYEFELGARYAMLEPMDIVTLTDPGLGMTRTPVRIIAIDEQDDSFAVTAEDLPIGIAAAATYVHDDGLRWQNTTNISPLSAAAPVIFELPADPSATGLSVAIAAGGQTSDLMYGGCKVWLSLDGTNYRQEGVIFGSSRYGTLSAALAANASGMDTTHTMSLALRSNGQMLSGSAADVAKGTTLIVCDGEYLAYQTAALTGVNAYNLTTLNRGLYGTTGGLHASGAAWVRVDDAIAVLRDLDLTMVGQVVYIKLTAFNVYGGGDQDLSAVSAYSYTITGNMKALQTPVDFANVGGVTKPANNATVGAPVGSPVGTLANSADVSTTIKVGGGVAVGQVITSSVVAGAITTPVGAAGSTTAATAASWGGYLKIPSVDVTMGVATTGQYEVEIFLDMLRDTLAWLSGDVDIFSEALFQLNVLSAGGTIGSGTTPGAAGIGGQTSVFSDYKYWFVNGQTPVMANTIRLRHTERIFRPDLIGQTVAFEAMFRTVATGLRSGQTIKYGNGSITVREIKK